MSEFRPSELHLSVIVPTCNREAALADCLAGLAAQTLAPKQFEVVVVDDSGATAPENTHISDLGTARVRSLRHPQNLGAAAARNTGAHAAQAPCLAFIDDDCIPEPQWAAEILHQMVENPGAALAGVVVIDEPGPATDRVTQYLSSPTAAEDGSIARAQSANLAVSAEGFASIGGFDPLYIRAGYEDYDFCLRWRRSGRTIISAPEAIVRHKRRTDLGGFLRQHFRYGRGAALYYGQGPDGPHPPHMEILKRMFETVGAGRGLWQKTTHLGLVGLSQIAMIAGFASNRLFRS